MSFRKANSFLKNDKKTDNLDNSLNPIDLLMRFFNKNPNVSLHKRTASNSFSAKYSTNVNIKQSTEFEFLWNLELVIIYTANLVRQKIDNLNRLNLQQQFLQCAKFLQNHLNESQTFVENLNAGVPNLEMIKESLCAFQIAHRGFSNWIESVAKCNDVFDVHVGQDLFFAMEIKAQVFIDRLKPCFRNTDRELKRVSIDNSSLINMDQRSIDSDSSKRSCFNDEDRELIDKLKKLDDDCDHPPPKPAKPKIDDNLDNYLKQIEEVANSRKQNDYDYPIIEINNDMKSVKIENNCIMASSMISEDIPPVDIDSPDEFTPTPALNSNLSENGFVFNDPPEVEPISKSLRIERSRNCPLPPVPGSKKLGSRFKLAPINTSFPSEEIHLRKTTMIGNNNSRISNGSIVKIHHQSTLRSPLRSPSIVSSINFHNNKSSATKVPASSNDCHSNKLFDGANNFHSFDTTRQLLMAKQIPSVLNDPNDLLNINDMQDDIDIITRSFDAFSIDNRTSKRISELSSQTNPEMSLQSKHPNASVFSTNNDETYCNSEVKSDTEEYFEYIEIDGKKYRRKMKKRIVIEKIKIRKTILAPMKPDGSGPDLAQLKNDEIDKNLMDDIIDRKENVLLRTSDQSSDGDTQPRFRRGPEDRFRVSKLMFNPYRDQMKRMTLCHPPNSKVDANNKLFPLMNKYMYRFGESNCEEPVIDKRFSTQLTDAVYSTWFKTSESILPHEKSKSIYYLKKSRQKNDDGATVHNAVRVTASRTIRMKIPDKNGEQPPSIPNNSILPIGFNFEDDESALDGDDSDTSNCITDTSASVTDPRKSQFDSCLLSSDDEKDDDTNEISYKSDSLSSETDEGSNKRTTLDDPELPDSYLNDSLESIPIPSQRCISSDSCFFSHGSYISETKDQYSFILKENNATPYLIFDEEPKDGECDIAGGPVDALIVYACDVKDFLFLGAFLDTYRTFIDSEELIYRLTVRYRHFRSKLSSTITNPPDNENQSPETSEDYPDKKCKHVLSLLLTIIGKLKRDLNDHIMKQIEQFQNYLSNLKETTWVEAISKTIEGQKQTMAKDDKIVQRLQQLSECSLTQIDVKLITRELGSPTKILAGSSGNKLSIVNFSSREIAEQITLLDWSKYRDVELTEILNLKDIVNCNLIGVIEYAKNFENVQNWTQSILLDPDRASDRDRICMKFIRIMKHLQRLKNFSSFIAILLAIQLLPTNKMFSKRVRSKIKEYDNYMKPPRFSGYKEDLKNALAPCIPFLGIFYQDIVMLNIANPPYLDLDEIIKNADKSHFSSNNNQLLLNNAINCGPIINFWRSFKQYIFLKNCNKDQDKIRYSIEPNEKILQFLNNFKDSFDDTIIQRIIKQSA